MTELIDLTGKTFDRLTVIERVGTIRGSAGKPEPAWKVRCECGRTQIVDGRSLRRGDVKSCGCLAKDVKVKKGDPRTIEAAKKGGAAARAKSALPLHEAVEQLGKLETTDDAKRWLSTIATWTLAGRISASAAARAVETVKVWLRVEDFAQRIYDLEQRLHRLERGNGR